MKKLEENFIGIGEVKGSVFQQIIRKGSWCIYQVNESYFEVIKVREQLAKEVEIQGKTIEFEEKEIYPQSHHWFNEKTFLSYNKAFDYFTLMTKNDI